MWSYVWSWVCVWTYVVICVVMGVYVVIDVVTLHLLPQVGAHACVIRVGRHGWGHTCVVSWVRVWSYVWS